MITNKDVTLPTTGPDIDTWPPLDDYELTLGDELPYKKGEMVNKPLLFSQFSPNFLSLNIFLI